MPRVFNFGHIQKICKHQLSIFQIFNLNFQFSDPAWGKSSQTAPYHRSHIERKKSNFLGWLLQQQQEHYFALCRMEAEAARWGHNKWFIFCIFNKRPYIKAQPNQSPERLRKAHSALVKRGPIMLRKWGGSGNTRLAPQRCQQQPEHFDPRILLF